MLGKHATAATIVLLLVSCAFAPFAVSGADVAASDPETDVNPTSDEGIEFETTNDQHNETNPEREGVSVDVSVSSGSVTHPNSTTAVWLSGTKTVSVRVRPVDDSEVRVCVEALSDGGTGNDSASNATTRTEIGCRERSNQYFDLINNFTEKFTVDGWPTNGTGERTIVATVESVETSETLARSNRTVVLVTREGDFDSDRLSNDREAELGTGINRTDTDSDGLRDGPEVMEYGTDPLSKDSDDDGLNDAPEINGETNATDPDTDDDGLLDGAEVNEYDTDPTGRDSDGDGLSDAREVNGETDPSEADTDGDGLDDASEVNGETNATNTDTDGDSLMDGAEVNVYGTDPTDADTDGDGLADAHEVSIGSDPNNPLTSVFIALAVVTLIGLLFLAQRRVLPDLPTFDSSDDGEEAASGAIRGNGSGPAVEIEPEPVPPGMLSDEDRIIQLLREENGRIPQNEIIEKTDWSKSKVSRLLSKMADNGDVEKIDVGRQNIIALQEAVPENARSPFEDTTVDE